MKGPKTAKRDMNRRFKRSSQNTKTLMSLKLQHPFQPIFAQRWWPPSTLPPHNFRFRRTHSLDRR